MGTHVRVCFDRKTRKKKSEVPIKQGGISQVHTEMGDMLLLAFLKVNEMVPSYKMSKPTKMSQLDCSNYDV